MKLEKFSIHEAVLGIADIRHIVAIMFNTTDLFLIKKILEKSNYPFGRPESFVSNINEIHESWLNNNKEIDNVSGYLGVVDPFDKLEEKYSFENLLWEEVKNVEQNQTKDLALVVLYNKLTNEINAKNNENCNNFLKYLIGKTNDTDYITHILNVFTPIKNELSYFYAFSNVCKNFYIEKYGDLEGTKIFNTIIQHTSK